MNIFDDYLAHNNWYGFGAGGFIKNRLTRKIKLFSTRNGELM